ACALSGNVVPTFTPPPTPVFSLVTATIPPGGVLVTVAPPNLGLTVVVNSPPAGLPTFTPQMTLVNGTPCNIPAGWQPYAVQVGDTLSSLAVQVGSTIDQIASANCITDVNTIEVGQIIFLPRVLPTAPTG